MKMVHLRSTVAAALLVAGVATLAAAQAQQPIDPTRYEGAIQAFEAADHENMPPPGAIVVTGSSSIARWNDAMPAALAPLTVVPRGFGGSAMADVLHFVDRVVIAYQPRAVVIYEGDNDTGRFFVPPMTIAAELKQIIAAVHAELPETRVYVMSVKPSLARAAVWDKAQETNALYRKVAAAYDHVHYIDVATPFLNADGTVMDDIFIADGLHLNEKGNRIWGATIKAALMPLEAQFESTND